MAVAREASLEQRVEHAVRAAVDARREQLVGLVRARLDAELVLLADEVVAEQLTPRSSRLCSVCGQEPRLSQRTVCRPCLRVRARELHQVRVARRREGSAPAADDEEPRPVGASNGRRPRRERVRRPESAQESATGVNGNGGGIAAEELARRAGARNLPGLSADELKAWLRDAGLAEATPAGLLVPTPHGRELAASLGPS